MSRRNGTKHSYHQLRLERLINNYIEGKIELEFPEHYTKSTGAKLRRTSGIELLDEQLFSFMRDYLNNVKTDDAIAKAYKVDKKEVTAVRDHWSELLSAYYE